ncbi:Methyltransferase LaeA [Pleurostoma richardsiae]|uniref:Methyltransferase LaeA n=1 Tax=Pleurostoma richardsiae TaxID=41990 RepID=A0AA38RAG7_9PEZI|nr:Methyltransferase LaeA [Pleurostoma richardsiae]
MSHSGSPVSNITAPPTASVGGPGLGSVLDPVTGRYYHAWHKGQYLFPCDEDERDRLDIFHKFFLIARKDRLFSAPIVPDRDGPRILDLGTGTGIWAVDVADQFRTGEVRGTDLSMMQPSAIPPNLRFIPADMESPWYGLGEDSWDLIHMRTLSGSVTSWPHLYAKVFAHLKPMYGFIEHVEIDWEPRSDDGPVPPRYRDWVADLYNAMDTFGRSMRIERDGIKNSLAAVGFVDITEESIRIPINGWPADPHEKDMGEWFNLGLTFGLPGLTYGAFSKVLGKSKDEMDRIVNDVKRDITNRSYHAYCTLYIWNARRPGPSGR